jgi:hypothetical protein
MFRPQQKANPAVVNAQLCAWPVLTDWKVGAAQAVVAVLKSTIMALTKRHKCACIE